VFGRVRELVEQLSRPKGREAWLAEIRAVPALVRWVLPWAVLGSTRRNANPVKWLQRAAKNHPDRIALSHLSETVSFGQLVAQTELIASSLGRQGVRRTERVAILATTSPEMVRSLLACFWLGAVPCLLDSATPPSLLDAQLAQLKPDWFWPLDVDTRAEPVHSSATNEDIPRGGEYRQLHRCVTTENTNRWQSTAVAPIAARDTALILPTSGSEGYPKLCKISLGRLILAGHSFGGYLLRVRAKSVIYCALPLTHATAIMGGLMSMLVHGCRLHLDTSFSASRFLRNVADAGGTHVLYVGELLRFVLAKTQTSGDEQLSRIERFVGNGLDKATWEGLAILFPRAGVVEFYGATELPALIVNLSGRSGAMGRVPLRAWSRFRVAELPEGKQGSRIPSTETVKPCAAMEPGELLVAMPLRTRPVVGAFEGYVDDTHEQRALLRDVFSPGDCYYRTGDRVYFDRDDFFYFVERLGDVWRNRGHNVSLRWVAEQLCQSPAIEACTVVPVALDDSSTRVGLALVILRDQTELRGLSVALESLPSYAQPALVKLETELDLTRSFKRSFGELRRDIFVPLNVEESVYAWDGVLIRCTETSWPKLRARMLGSRLGIETQ